MPPVDKHREGVYLIVFTVQFIGWLGVAVLRDSDAIAVLHVMSPAVVVSTATTYVLVQGMIMLAERYLKRRYAEGKAEGEANAYAKIRDWLKRKEAAESRGEPFNEPPPMRNPSPVRDYVKRRPCNKAVFHLEYHPS